MEHTFKKTQAGFTFAELIVVMSVMSVLLGLTAFNLLGAKSKADIGASVQVLIADIKQSQLKAMTGDTEGRQSSDVYGIHFDADSYVLFHGLIYSPSDSSNFKIFFNDNVQAANPGFNLIFDRISGEVVNFSQTQNTITLTNSSNGEQRTIQFNRYGVVIAVN